MASGKHDIRSIFARRSVIAVVAALILLISALIAGSLAINHKIERTLPSLLGP